MRPFVSIGMPVFNGERYIEEAIASILAQTESDFELIISDNASTDRTGEICRLFAARDPRIRYRRNKTNLGAAENYNRVFWAASGPYFKWAAHDDICAPEFLQRCTEMLEKDPGIVLCYPRTIFINEKGERLSEFAEEVTFEHAAPHQRLRTWLMERPGGWCNLVFGVMRKDVLGQTGLIGKYQASDYILVGELAMLGKLHELPDALFFRRDHPGRSGVAHAGLLRTALWFDPAARKNGFYCPRWRWLGEYLKAVARARIALREKIKSAAVVIRWAIRFRSLLREDIVVAFRQFAQKRSSNEGTLS